MTQLNKILVQNDLNETASVLTHVEEQVAEIILNRPEILNALNQDLATELTTRLQEYEENPDIRCVVLRGNGPAFMAGGDIGLFQSVLHLDATEREGIFKQFVQGIHPAIECIKRMPKPVIASVHGAAAGFGVSLMAACDLAIASTTSYFTLAYAGIGLTPDGGATYSLVRSLGLKKAMELCLLGERIDTEQAMDIGLINFVVADDQLEKETRKLALRLAKGPTQAYARTKHLLHQSLQHDLTQQLTAEENAFAVSSTTNDFVEGVKAFMEKRIPQFTGQ